MTPQTEPPAMPSAELESRSPMAPESHGNESEGPDEDNTEDENEDEDDDDNSDDDESVFLILEGEDSEFSLGKEVTFPEPTLRGCEWLEGAVDGDTVEGWGFLPYYVDDDGALVYPHPMSYYDPFHPDHNGRYGSLSAEDQRGYERMGNMPRWPDLMLVSCLAPNGPTLPSIHNVLAAPTPTSNELAPLQLPSDPSVFQRVRDARDEMHAWQQREAFGPVVESSPVSSSSLSSSSTRASSSSTGASSSSSLFSSSGAEPDWLMAAKDSVAASFEPQQQSTLKRRLEVELGREVGAQPGFGLENSRLDCLRGQNSNDGVVRGLGMELRLANRLLKRARRS